MNTTSGIITLKINEWSNYFSNFHFQTVTKLIISGFVPPLPYLPFSCTVTELHLFLPAYSMPHFESKHTLHEVSNQIGELVCNFAIENNMTVMSTHFQHKTIHKGTWTSPDHSLYFQSDYARSCIHTIVLLRMST